jgi:D-alanyl-D-alanine carboxypeptidase (penicillin-binding protein 5/6)/beta-lactamase class A
MKHFTLSFLCIFLCALCALCGEPSLEDRLAPLVKSHKGQVAIAVKHLGTGESYYLNADEPMTTASLIKVAVMIETYWQVQDGKVKLDAMLTLKKDDMVPGSGVLTDNFSPGATFCLRDAVRLMIAVSDNTATNMVLDQTGIREVNQRMEKLGFPDTRINAKSFKGSTTSVDPERTKKFGLGCTTAREMTTIFEGLHQGKFVSPDACKEMIEHLKKCSDKDCFPRFLPETVKLAHKTGAVSDARTDSGILYFKEGPVVLCVLTNKNEDKRWAQDNAGSLLCAKVAKEVYEYFNHKDCKEHKEDTKK